MSVKKYTLGYLLVKSPLNVNTYIKCEIQLLYSISNYNSYYFFKTRMYLRHFKCRANIKPISVIKFTLNCSSIILVKHLASTSVKKRTLATNSNAFIHSFKHA